MNSRKTTFAILLLFVLSFAVSTIASARDYYQIKVYTIKDKAQEQSIDDYLEKAYLPAMHKAGVKEIGVFKPIADDKAAGTKIFVFIPLKNLAQIEKLEKNIAKDGMYQAEGDLYINAPHDKPPYERIETILLKAFANMPEYFMPSYDTPKSKQIFELRSYEGATEKIWKKKVHMFNEGGEIGVFKDVGSNAIFYGEVIAGSAMPNLMYLTSYSSMESNKEHWNAFRKHPVWEKLKNMPEYANTVSHINKWMLHPTEYSDF